MLMPLQRADRRLNAQLLDSELDDTLESFEGGCNLGSSAVASLRGSAKKQSTGVAREKDKADRATYQTVLDPRTRLVSHAPNAPVFAPDQSFWHEKAKSTDSNVAAASLSPAVKPQSRRCIKPVSPGREFWEKIGFEDVKWSKWTVPAGACEDAECWALQ